MTSGQNPWKLSEKILLGGVSPTGTAHLYRGEVLAA
jgi:hypothetical protein